MVEPLDLTFSQCVTGELISIDDHEFEFLLSGPLQAIAVVCQIPRRTPVVKKPRWTLVPLESQVA